LLPPLLLLLLLLLVLAVVVVLPMCRSAVVVVGGQRPSLAEYRYASCGQRSQRRVNAAPRRAAKLHFLALKLHCRELIACGGGRGHMA